MLIVKIFANKHLIKEGTAQRVGPITDKEVDPKTMGAYRLHNDKVINHRYGDGAVELAKKILEEMKE